VDRSPIWKVKGQPPNAALLDTIHRAKTGALLRASLRLGAIYAGAPPDQYEALSTYGEHIGLAFQIVDDILDVEESPKASARPPEGCRSAEDYLPRSLWPGVVAANGAGGMRPRSRRIGFVR